MKKIRLLMALMLSAVVMFSCKKEPVKSEAISDQAMNERLQYLQGLAATAKDIVMVPANEVDAALAARATKVHVESFHTDNIFTPNARCTGPSASYSTGIDYVTLVAGPGGTIVYLNISTYCNVDSAHANLRVRKMGQVPGDNVWQLMGESVYGIGTGLLPSYMVIVPTTIGMPVDLSTQFYTNCRTINNEYVLNYSAPPPFAP